MGSDELERDSAQAAAVAGAEGRASQSPAPGATTAAPGAVDTPARGISGGRLVVVDAMIVLATMLLIVGVFSVCRRQTHAAPASASASGSSVADQLQQLTQLRDQGALTTAEYQAAKTHLLHA